MSIKPDPLHDIIADTERELSAFLPNVRSRILKRIQAAYFLGAVDGLKNVCPSAERRLLARERHAKTGTE